MQAIPRQSMDLDRETASALVEAGYMPLEAYVSRFGAQPARPDKRRARPDKRRARPALSIVPPAPLRPEPAAYPPAAPLAAGCWYATYR